MRNPAGATSPTDTGDPATTTTTTTTTTNPTPGLSSDLRDYAEDLLAGAGIDVMTVLAFSLTGELAASDLHGDLAPALWAGWSATARHTRPAGPDQLPLPDLATTATDGDDQ